VCRNYLEAKASPGASGVGGLTTEPLHGRLDELLRPCRDPVGLRRTRRMAPQAFAADPVEGVEAPPCTVAQPARVRNPRPEGDCLQRNGRGRRARGRPWEGRSSLSCRGSRTYLGLVAGRLRRPPAWSSIILSASRLRALDHLVARSRIVSRRRSRLPVSDGGEVSLPLRRREQARERSEPPLCESE
jgi:hypothetical protein